MTQALSKQQVTFDEFIAWYPENDRYRYELHDGIIVKMPPPTGEREEVVGFVAEKLTLEYSRLKLPYFIPKTAFVKTKSESVDSAYSPDVVLLNRSNLINEPLWKKESTVLYAASIPLVVEVVSTNWRDDYLKKVADYELLGIPEYWIIDYKALGGRRYIGNPKQETISVYTLVDDEYQVTQFRGDDRIESLTFPDISLTLAQIQSAIISGASHH
jgi:Uma2 family endonuclease